MDPATLRRIRWRCRRGILELDVVLQAYVEQRFDSLDASQQQAFSRLLDYPDPSLLKWLSGDGEDVDKDVRDIVKQVREFTSTGT